MVITGGLLLVPKYSKEKNPGPFGDQDNSRTVGAMETPPITLVLISFCAYVADIFDLHMHRHHKYSAKFCSVSTIYSMSPDIDPLSWRLALLDSVMRNLQEPNLGAEALYAITSALGQYRVNKNMPSFHQYSLQIQLSTAGEVYGKMNCLTYSDDLVLLAEHSARLQEKLDCLAGVLPVTGMSLNPAKSFGLTITKDGKAMSVLKREQEETENWGEAASRPENRGANPGLEEETENPRSQQELWSSQLNSGATFALDSGIRIQHIEFLFETASADPQAVVLKQLVVFLRKKFPEFRLTPQEASYRAMELATHI
ncbi:hypothetical protein NXF25_019584 [Crotalus adamanteus]|uniref:Reverse transcriptase domain-containing protein n=1 Tax=Crotalus adamanteus TaxID=8729 RepID=A0AAW1B2A1_CROAD